MDVKWNWILLTPLVVLGARVVEAVRELVADDLSDGAVADGGDCVGGEERRPQDPHRHPHAVHRRRVRRIHLRAKSFGLSAVWKTTYLTFSFGVLSLSQITRLNLLK